jgi:hypothetical protein
MHFFLVSVVWCWQNATLIISVQSHDIWLLNFWQSDQHIYKLQKEQSTVVMYPCPNKIPHVGFEVLTAVVMKSTVFWDIMPCSSLKVNWHFRGTYRLHLQGRRISFARNRCKRRWQAAAYFHAGFLLGLFYNLTDRGDKFLRNVSYFQRSTHCYITEDITPQIPHVYN